MKGFQRLMMAALLLTAVGCSRTPLETEALGVDDVFFPRQNFVPNAYMEAQLIGTLVAVDGCLKVDGPFPGPVTPIWPLGFTLRAEGDRLIIGGNERQPGVRLEVGRDIDIGGGEYPAEHLGNVVDAETQQTLEQQCSGPYFLVGDAS